MTLEQQELLPFCVGSRALVTAQLKIFRTCQRPLGFGFQSWQLIQLGRVNCSLKRNFHSGVQSLRSCSIAIKSNLMHPELVEPGCPKGIIDWWVDFNWIIICHILFSPFFFPLSICVEFSVALCTHGTLWTATDGELSTKNLLEAFRS